MARRTTMLAFLATILSVLLAFWAPLAIAGPGKDGAPGQQKKAEGETTSDSGDKDGDADSDPDTAYTEDNDTNDNNTPNNVSDEGDNQHPSGKDRSVENGGSGTQGKSESNPDDTNGPMRSEGEAGSPDKANGNGGEDLADQDGNNGCGNDDDFDDDNNGWCGKPAETDDETDDEVDGEVIVDEPCDADATMPGVQPCEKPTKPCDADATMPGVQECISNPPIVGGEVIVDVPCVRDSSMGSKDEECDLPTLPGIVTNPVAPEDTVLGERVTRGGNVAAAAVAPAAVAAGGATLPFTGGSIVQFLVTGLSLVTLGGVSILARKR